MPPTVTNLISFNTGEHKFAIDNKTYWYKLTDQEKFLVNFYLARKWFGRALQVLRGKEIR